MNLPLEAARLAAWATACLRGDVAPDDLAEHAGAPGQVHRVVGLGAGGGEGPSDGAVSLPLAVAELRRRRASRAWLVWPAPGDPAGLPGPVDVNRLAVEAGQAVVVEFDDRGENAVVLVPSRLGSSGVVWNVLAGEDARAAATSLADADRLLKSAMRESTEVLDSLDVARTRPEDERLIEAVHHRPPPIELPGGFPPRARMVVDTTQRLAGLLEIAALGDGAAVSRTEADRRRDVLRDLDRTVRHAFTAGVNALAEEGLRAR